MGREGKGKQFSLTCECHSWIQIDGHSVRQIFSLTFRPLFARAAVLKFKSAVGRFHRLLSRFLEVPIVFQRASGCSRTESGQMAERWLSV